MFHYNVRRITLRGEKKHSQTVCVTSQEMAVEVSRALAQGDPNLVLSAAFKLRITQRDLVTLQEGSWLNDEVT